MKDANTLCVDGDDIRVYSSEKPEDLPWAEEGKLTWCSNVQARLAHVKTLCVILHAGAKRVLFSHPADAESDVDRTIVYGVNHETLNAQMIVSCRMHPVPLTRLCR